MTHAKQHKTWGNKINPVEVLAQKGRLVADTLPIREILLFLDVLIYFGDEYVFSCMFHITLVRRAPLSSCVWELLLILFLSIIYQQPHPHPQPHHPCLQSSRPSGLQAPMMQSSSRGRTPVPQPATGCHSPPQPATGCHNHMMPSSSRGRTPVPQPATGCHSWPQPPGSRATKIDENLWTSMKIYENLWNSMTINENRRTSMKINENPWKSMKMYENVWKSI